MNQQEIFNYHLLGFFADFFLMLALMVITLGVFLVFLVTSQIFLLVISIGFMSLTFFRGYEWKNKYSNFRENLDGFFNKEDSIRLKLTKLPKDAPIRACLIYHNEKSLEKIQSEIGLDHPEQAKHLLVKGIGELLREYENRRNQE